MRENKYTTHTRVWVDVYDVFRNVALKYGFMVSDLVSLVLFEAALNPAIVFTAILRGFNVDVDVAGQAAEEIHNRALKLLQILCEAEEGLEEAVRVEKA